MRAWSEQAGLEVERQESEWDIETEQGTLRIGVPRFGDCITVVRRPA